MPSNRKKLSAQIMRTCFTVFFVIIILLGIFEALWTVMPTQFKDFVLDIKTIIVSSSLLIVSLSYLILNLGFNEIYKLKYLKKEGKVVISSNP